MCKSFIKQVLLEKCLPETQGKFSIFSRTWSLELTPKHGLKSSSVEESQCRNFKLVVMTHQKDHWGIKLLERTYRRYSIRMRLLSNLRIISQNLRGFQRVVELYCSTLWGAHGRASTRPDYVTKYRVEDRSQYLSVITLVHIFQSIHWTVYSVLKTLPIFQPFMASSINQ